MSECPYSYFDYYVQKGDTFALLAKKFSVEEAALREQNDDTRLKTGQKIKIPCQQGGCARGAFYTIKRGETLFRIAKQNGISVETMLSTNPYLNPSYYLPGQVIILPYVNIKKSSDEYYTLGEHERLFDVLRRYNMDITTFCSLNPKVSPMDVKGGQKIKIKKKTGTSSKRYTLKRGDNLISVANKFGIHVSSLLAANDHLKPTEFVPGISVHIPRK
ncbi:MAG: LysM peptidoglycan-binding domain-containing protein [Christensenellales bacterium]|jgi:LysM repeat protein